MKILLSLVVIMLLFMLISTDDNFNPTPCVPKYTSDYVKLSLPEEVQPVPSQSYERFYTEHMLKHLDDGFSHESQYKPIMRYTLEGATL
jgi:hypothetical protein